MIHLNDYQKLHCWSEGVYSYTFPLRLMGATFGRRMVVLRAEDKLLLISPMALPDSLAASLATLGDIQALVFPTCFHDTGTDKLGAALNDKPIFGSLGVERFLPGSRPINSLPAPWNEILQWHCLEGMPKINEYVFYHPNSKILLPSDLLFNFTEEFSPWTRLVAKISGTYPTLKPTRLFVSCIKDREAFNASLGRVLAWDFERILPAHAQVIGAQGRAALEAFLLQSSGGALPTP